MRAVRLLQIALLFFIMALAPASYGAVPTTGASSFITERVTQTLKLYGDPQLTPDQREERLHAIAVEMFDVPRITRFVMGRYWSAMSDADRRQFTRVFEHYLVHMYDGRFRAYHDITFRVTGERAESDTRTVVRSEILTRERYDPLKLDWWISKNGDSYKVMDVSIEGASQMLAHRDEFATYIQRNGGKVSSLMDRLRAMTEG